MSLQSVSRSKVCVSRLFLGPERSEKSTINLVAKCKGKDVLASYMWTASILL